MANANSRSLFGHHLETVKRWCISQPHWTLVLLMIAALVPFLAKPFNIDDPCYLWCAKQILSHPANPYGFDVNWAGSPQPMWAVMENPPLVCYFIAGGALVLGWSETAMHLLFLLPAMAVILGTYRLARQYCNSPLAAAVITLFMPVFVVSSTTVMCDVLMLAWWTWAVIFWVEGSAQERGWKMALAGLFMALAVMSKYNGICLVPLLAAYSLLQKHFRNLVFLLIPLGAVAAYQIITKKLYGSALLAQASSYAISAKGIRHFSILHGGLTGLAFVGGCFATAVFFMLLLWHRRTLISMAVLTATVIAATISQIDYLKDYAAIPDDAKMLVNLQIVFWATGGMIFLAMVIHELYKRRDIPTALLAMWILGTFVFSAFFNWTVNGRTLLPMAPAVGILLIRRFESRLQAKQTSYRAAEYVFAMSALLAMLVVQADFALAMAVRQSVAEIHTKYGSHQGTLWFDGNWGYQYYMEESGAVAADIIHPQLNTGDIIAVPLNNNILRPPDPEFSTMMDAVVVPVGSCLTTMNVTCGSGFYAATHGPLPFAFGHVPPQYVCIFAIGPAKKTSH